MSPMQSQFEEWAPTATAGCLGFEGDLLSLVQEDGQYTNPTTILAYAAWLASRAYVVELIMGQAEEVE